MGTLAPSTARFVLIAALTLGGIFDLLLRDALPGINFTILVAALALYASTLARRQRTAAPPEPWLAVAVLCASGLALRDSEELATLNIMGTMLALGMPFARPIGNSLLPEHLVRGAFATALNVATGAGRMLGRELRWPAVGGEARRFAPVAIGLVVALPLAAIFGALFAKADPVFARAVSGLFGFDFNLGPLMERVIPISIIAWLSAGYLRGTVVTKGPDAAGIPAARSFGPDVATGAAVALGVTASVFLAFVVVQASVMFGGAYLVRNTTGLTWAEYARRGFFELLAVAALTLPIMWATTAIRPEGRSARWLRAMEWLLAILVGLVLVSALNRMRLLVGVFGLSTTRIYGSAVMVWLAAVVTWFGVTALRNQRGRFLKGAMASGFGVLALLNVANPEALVVKVNAERAASGFTFDADYAQALSADAVPALLAVQREQGRVCFSTLSSRVRRWNNYEAEWRSWNLGRYRAVRAMREAEREGAAGVCGADVRQNGEEG